MAAGLRQVAGLPDPVGEVTDGFTRPNGLRMTRVRVPLGVVAVIYEARPNVTADAAALCLKSGNAALLQRLLVRPSLEPCDRQRDPGGHLRVGPSGRRRPGRSRTPPGMAPRP